ncbi:hypothetical protein [Dethiobacter alkaliphilus]|uniref:hypothetical protein n=1 Tax=Dethiobacter alkaliphilus TaxID=427926 RepID=UPI0022273083|nr:hypothetical protein [Dethiobacter alkaliphilus]MCW3489896.1 hypothetical protein [Dethiobacter alkaliphilus]
MKDRLVAGGVGGAIAGIIQYGYGLLAKSLGLTDRIFGQFSEVVLSSRVYTGTLGIIVGILSHLAVTVMFGVAFAYIIEKTSSRYLLIKATGYALVLWFLLSGFGTIFSLPLFEDIPPQPALVTLIGSFVYSIILAVTLKLFDNKTSLL